MKYILVRPISLYYDYIIWPGIPSLLGILESIGVDAEFINLNSEYNFYLTKENITEYCNQLKSFYENKEYLNYPEFCSEKFLNIKNLYEEQCPKLINNAKNCSLYKQMLKDGKALYKSQTYKNITDMLLYIRVISLFCTCIIEPVSEIYIKTDDIFFIFNSSLNNFKDFYKEKVDVLLEKNPDVIGIQITKTYELISGLYLCYLIKQKNKHVHINIGGRYFEEFYKKIINLKDFFELFFDSISIGDCTSNIVDIVKYINKEITEEKIRNVIYAKNGEIKVNIQDEYTDINKLPYQSFNGYKKEDYCLPELVLPVRASNTHSCYWGKCIYCTCSGKNEPYRLMSVDRFTQEIEYLSKKYNTKYFAFWDNSFHPKYLDKTADILIKNKLKIKYTLYARLEKGFDKKLLVKLKKSGCIAIHWGLDSASPRILDYINKGINIKTAKKVLEFSHKAGILNFVYFLMGLPTETVEDLDENLKFLKENSRNIDVIDTAYDVMFLDGAVLNNDYEYYQSQINKTEEYDNYKSEIISKMHKIIRNYSINYHWEYLYIAKYGLMRFKIRNFLNHINKR